jgi:NAD(P)-dependent dehydrogenase (short-subunit alcohol dehydrogenase family)
VNGVSSGTMPSEVGHADAVSVLANSSLKPNLTEEEPQKILDSLAQQTALGRLGPVEDMAGPAHFLLSDDAAYITGAKLFIDDGRTAWWVYASSNGGLIVDVR